MTKRSFGQASIISASLALACGMLTAAAAASAAPPMLKLAWNGKTGYVIAEAGDATKNEKHAAGELAEYLGRTTGADFERVDESAVEAGRPAMYVGWTKYARTQGVDLETLDNEEWVLRSVGDDLILTGGRQRGTMYAVYEFLEEHVGCHWLDPITESVPREPTLMCPRLDIQAKPHFWTRNIYTAIGHSRYYGPMTLPVNMSGYFKYMLRNRENGTPRQFGKWGGFDGIPRRGRPSCHSFSYWLPADEYFDEHPEYYSLNHEGKRLPARTGAGPGQLCLSHPDVRRIVAARMREAIARDRKEALLLGCPPPRVYDFSMNDNGNLCQCEDCQAIAEREGSQSGPVIAGVNAIATNVAAAYPEVYIQTFAYNATQPPPQHLKPHQNVIVRWCDVYSVVDGGRPLRDPLNAKNYGEIVAWGRITQQVAVWDYWRTFGYYEFPTPYSAVECVVSDLRLFAECGCRRLSAECEHEIGDANADENFFALKKWIAYKLLVEPKRPVEPLIETFLRGYYGAAAPQMQALRHYMRQRYDREAGFKLLRNAPHKLAYLDLEFFAKANTYFDAALQEVAPDSLDALHVKKERLTVDGAHLYLWPWLERTLAPGKEMPFDHEAVIRRYAADWRAYAERYNASKALPLREAWVAAQVKAFQAQLPEPFRDRPRHEVADFNWLTFSSISPRQSIVADPVSACGKAAVYTDEEGRLIKGLTIGMSAGPTVELKPEQIRSDGRYHLYKLGRCNIKNRSLIWAVEGQKVGTVVDRLFVPDAEGSTENDWDVYLSLRFSGPDFVAASGGTNQLWLDRVLLVKPDPEAPLSADDKKRLEREKELAARRAKPPQDIRVPRLQQDAGGDPLSVDWSRAVDGGEWSTIIGYATERNVRVRFARDDKHIYLRLIDDMAPADLRIGSSVWAGDGWEVFFAPERGCKPYRQMGINPCGKYQALAYGEDSGNWDSGATVVSATNAGCWEVSLSLPLRTLWPTDAKTWRVFINIIRSSGNPDAALAWSPNFEVNYHLLDRLREVVLQ